MTGPHDGRHVGRYCLEEVIGTGAFSTVHRATDERLDDVVAVKVLAENHSLDVTIRERFLTEGRVLRRIDSPHVVGVFDLGETEQQQLYLVLEHADAGTLAERVAGLRATGWRPGAADLLAVARPLAAGIGAVHGAEVVHRDLSPGNILLRSTLARTGNGTAVTGPHERLLLADLGLCKDLAHNSGLTATGGTEGFRPPEQRGRATPVTFAADLWALSALMVWLLTGAPPRDGHAPATSADVDDTGGEGDSLHGAIRIAGLPDQVAGVLERGLATAPADRQPDVVTWLAELERALAPPRPPNPPAPHARSDAMSDSAVPAESGAPTGFDAPAGSAVSPVPAAGPPRRWHRRFALLGAGAVAGAALVLGVWLPGGGPEVTELDDDEVHIEQYAGQSSLAIVGPVDVAVGDTAAFTVDADGVEQWTWVDPAGALHRDATGIEVEARSAGEATVRLIGVSANGDSIEVSHRLQVHDGEG